MKLVDLDSRRKKEPVDEVNHDAIELLESTIERVKGGELVAVGVSWVSKDDSIGGNISSGSNGITMWASLEHLARQFHNDLLDASS